MKKDIAYLLNEVAEIKTKQLQEQQGQLHPDHNADEKASNSQVQDGAGSTDGGRSGREDALQSMDKVHADKWQHNEDELLQNNPDFHASKRLKDMTPEEIQHKKKSLLRQ